MSSERQFEEWRPAVLVVGDGLSGLAEAATSVIGRQASAERTESPEEAATLLAAGAFDLLVAVRGLPVSGAAPMRRLVESAPDSDRVQLLGTWCEGEARTGRPVEGFRRVFWHAWPAWWATWLKEHRGMTDLESLDDPLAEATIALVADSDASWSIGAALADHGARCVSLGALERPGTLIGAPTAYVWDGSQLGGAEAERLRVCCETARPSGTPVVALLDFPRPETVAAAEALGAAAVVGKPCDRELLCESIRTAIAARRIQPKRSIKSVYAEETAGVDELPRAA